MSSRFTRNGGFDQYVCKDDMENVFLEHAWLLLGGTRQRPQHCLILANCDNE